MQMCVSHRGATVGVDIDLFNFQNLLHTQDQI